MRVCDCECVPPSCLPLPGALFLSAQAMPWWNLSAITWIKREHILQDSFHCSAIHVDFLKNKKKNPYETLRTLLLQSSILGYLPSFVCFSRFPGWLLKLPEFSKDRRALHYPCWDASFFHTGTVWFKLVPLLLVLILKNGCNKSLWYEASGKVAGIKTRDLKCSLFSKIGLEVTECIWAWQTFSVKGKIVNIWALGAVQPCTSTEWRWRSSPGQWWRAGCVPVKTDKNRQWAGLGLQAIACQLPAQRSGK